MNSLIKNLQKFSDQLISPDISVEKKYNILRAIREMDVTMKLKYLKMTKLDRAVKKCYKLEGEPGILAERIIKKWRRMIPEISNCIDEKNLNHDEFKPNNEYADTKPYTFQPLEKSKKQSIDKFVEQNYSESSSESDSDNNEFNDIKLQSKIQISEEHSSSDFSNSDDKFKIHKQKIFQIEFSESDNETVKPATSSQINKKSIINNKAERSKVNKSNMENKFQGKYSSHSDSSECEEFINGLKTYSNKANHHKEIQYENDSDCNEAYINFFKEEQPKLTSEKLSKSSKLKIDNLDFLFVDNNPKKIVKAEKSNIDIKIDRLSNKQTCENNSLKKQIKIEKINSNIDIKKSQIEKSAELKSVTNNASLKTNSNSDAIKHKRKLEIKTSFETFLKDSAMFKPTEINSKKRKSEILSTHNDSKRPNLQLQKCLTNFMPTDLSELPALNSSLSYSDMDEQSVYNRTDLILQKKGDNINDFKEDVDCTTKYSSERKIWTPKSRNDVIKKEIVEENLRTINGVLETEIAQYNYEKLMAFEGDNRKIMRKTECFWEKLFKKNHKSANKREGEAWRDAYLRIQRDQDYKLKELSERLKKTTEQSLNAVSKAKLLTNSNLAKPRRKMTGMRR